MIGAAGGGMSGLYKGLIETKNVTGAVRRTQLINYVTKRVSGTSNVLGSIAVMYSCLGCMLYYGRGKQEDFINTLVAGGLTGALYQCAGGLRRAGIGGAVGLGISAAIAAFHESDKTDDRLNYSSYF